MKVLNRHRILYAEDNEDACLMLSTLLGFSGIDVFSAHTMREAFQEARNKHFDVYLLGSGFSDGSDLELCRLLRELNPQTPIVFYSNDAYKIDRQNGLVAGAQAYLIKPEIDTVLPTILRLTAQVSESAEIRALDEFYVNPPAHKFRFRQMPVGLLLKRMRQKSKICLYRKNQTRFKAK